MAAFDFPNNPNNGDNYTANGITWTWDGSSWRRTSAVGAQGNVGAQGAAGAQGGTGVTGAQGAQGHQGHQGQAGTNAGQGAQGAAGAQGAQGHQGAVGTGAQGATGAQGGGGGTGAQGAVGAQGAAGAQGSAGAQGGLSTYAIPSGGIIIWSGAANAIPSGWVLCNGANSTPDLRNRFIVGAGSGYGVGNVGGADTVTLSESQMPSHYHFAFRSGNHGQLRNGSNMSSNNYPGSGSGAGNLYESYNISASGSVSNVGRTSNTGSGSAHENRPPYYALCYIMKT